MGQEEREEEGRLMRFAILEPQVFPDQAEACEGPEAEQAYPSLDPPADGQHH